MPNTNCTPNLKRYLQRENRTTVETLRKAIKDREVRDEDYPRVAVACEYGNHQAYAHSLKCHSSIRVPVSYVSPLYQALSAFGNPPEVKKDPISGRLVFIGTCAEDFAANQVMVSNQIASGHYPHMKRLVFTEPIRMRTGQRVKFCKVCNTVF